VSACSHCVGSRAALQSLHGSGVYLTDNGAASDPAALCVKTCTVCHFVRMRLFDYMSL
jgi:hypothetical protein